MKPVNDPKWNLKSFLEGAALPLLPSLLASCVMACSGSDWAQMLPSPTSHGQQLISIILIFGLTPWPALALKLWVNNKPFAKGVCVGFVCACLYAAVCVTSFGSGYPIKYIEPYAKDISFILHYSDRNYGDPFIGLPHH